MYAELPGAQHAFEVFASVRTGHVIRGIERFLAYVRATHVAPSPGLGADADAAGAARRPDERV